MYRDFDNSNVNMRFYFSVEMRAVYADILQWNKYNFSSIRFI